MHPHIDSPFANRLEKNFRHRRRWAARSDLEAYRVYDRDMPEYPVAVDLYADHAHISAYPRRRDVRGGGASQQEDIQAACAAVLGIPHARQHWKTHLPAGLREGQYERVAHGGERLTVREQGLRFQVNLTDFLDTGLFLDHRNTRARVREESRQRRVLNLFGYTGSFTVYAAAGGARSTTTVDLSSTYLDWARENMRLNDLLRPTDRMVCADATAFLESEAATSYDLVVLDPPSFSKSKEMRGSWDVQRDHPRLLAAALRVLAPEGILYFSTNRVGFELGADRIPARFEELTPASLPDDFTRKDSHRCWRVTAQGAGSARGAPPRRRR